MKEIVEKLLDEVHGAWRFRWYALLAAWVICLLGWSYVLVMPNRYEAGARVFVDPTTALKPVIKDIAIEQDVNAELNLVRQSLLSEPALRKVVDVTGLSKNIDRPDTLTKLIDAVRARIEVTISSSGPAGVETASKIYSLKYFDSDRDRALRILTMLMNNLVEGTLGGKRQGSIAAQKFLEEQIKDYEQRLAASEDRLAQFKKQNVGMVPGEDKSDYFTRLQTEMDSVKKTQANLNMASTRREALQKQLRGEIPIAASSSGPATGPGGNSPPGGGDTLSRIKETQARLDDLLLRFTEKHPDVIAMRQTLVDLKQRRASELEALKRGDPNAAALTGASSNPVYQSIQLALNQSEVEIAGLRQELGDHEQKVGELRKMLDTMPQVEAEYARLNRDYNVTKAQYTALADRLEKARVGEEADATGSVRFEVIEPPTVSFKPVSPRRPMLMAGILAAAFAIGGGLAYGLNMLRPVFNSVGSLANTTKATVLGAISISRSPTEIVAQRRGLTQLAGAAAGLVVLFVVAVMIARQFAPLLAQH